MRERVWCVRERGSMVCERKRGYGVREGVWYERGSVRERGSMVCERERVWSERERGSME